MIIWIASYPKSGNTWVRLFLRSYFCKEEKQFSINQKEADEFKINQFPNLNILKEMNINYNNFDLNHNSSFFTTISQGCFSERKQYNKRKTSVKRIRKKFS